MLNPDVITLCDAAGLVEFASVEPGEIPKAHYWHTHANAGYKPWAQVLPEIRAGTMAGLLVRVTPQGRAELARMRLGAPTGPAMEAPAATPKPNGSDLSAEARALAALTDHPDWSNKEIATAAGVHPSTLYRMPKFKLARQIAKSNKPSPKDRRKGRTGKGECDTLCDTECDTFDNENL